MAKVGDVFVGGEVPHAGIYYGRDPENSLVHFKVEIYLSKLGHLRVRNMECIAYKTGERWKGPKVATTHFSRWTFEYLGEAE